MDKGDPRDRDQGERDRRRLERLLPELIKRLVESSVGKIADGSGNVRQIVGDLRLPKDVLSFLLSQVDDTKTGLYRVTAKEIRDFLEHTDFAEQFSRVLTTLSFEIKTEVRFIPNDSRAGVKPQVRARAKVKRGGKRGDSEIEEELIGEDITHSPQTKAAKPDKAAKPSKAAHDFEHKPKATGGAPAVKPSPPKPKRTSGSDPEPEEDK